MRLKATVVLVTILIVGASIWWQARHTPEGASPPAEAQAQPAPGAARSPVAMERAFLARPSSIPDVDLTNVADLSEAARQRLAKEGIVAVPLQHSLRIAAGYANLKQTREPVLVTTDAALHVSHQVFDWTLRFLEVAHLSGDLTNLSDALLAQMMAYVDQAPSKELKAAALDCALYLTVGKRLLAGGDTEGVPGELAAKVNGELALIEKAEGLARSPLFGYAEDYSQYRPRGHYTRSEAFQRYFRAMMWYGRMRFLVQASRRDPRLGGLTAEGVKHQTRQALLLCLALRQTKVKGEAATQVWRRIYDTTAFFAGKADDLTLGDFLPAITATYGQAPTLSGLAEEGRLTQFQRAAAQLRPPQVLSTCSLGGAGEKAWTSETKGLALFGTRFALDSSIFQQLIFDRVGAYQGPQPSPPITAVATAAGLIRGFPLALDLLSVFGSPEAGELIRAGHDDAYRGYADRLQAAREQLAAAPETTWTSDLYHQRLDAIRHCLADPDQRAPAFMKREPWLLKQHQTALGAWTELRHDTILYTKQNYAVAQSAISLQGKGGPPVRPAVVKGYVEPCPEVYRILEAGFRQAIRILTTDGYPPDSALTGNLERCANLMAQLALLSDQELAGAPLTEEQYEFIENIGSNLAFMLMFPHNWDVAEPFQTEMDREMPVVADVATNVDAQAALEEAVGWPLKVFAVAPIEGRPTVCRGFAYSYYEFRWPMNDRLTDEKWRAMLERAEGQPKPRPTWTTAFVAESGPSPEAQQGHQ